jgi:hypothetical protein
VPAEVEQKRLGELATVYAIVFAEVVAGKRRRVNVERLLSVVGTTTEDVGTVRDKVVEGREHFWEIPSQLSSLRT